MLIGRPSSTARHRHLEVHPQHFRPDCLHPPTPRETAASTATLECRWMTSPASDSRQLPMSMDVGLLAVYESQSSSRSSSMMVVLA